MQESIDIERENHVRSTADKPVTLSVAISWKTK